MAGRVEGGRRRILCIAPVVRTIRAVSTEVVVQEADLQAGTLPPVCVLTGQPADQRLPVRFSTSSRRAVLLAFFNVLWYAIARYATRKTAIGTLPIASPAYADLRRRRRLAVAAWIGGPLLAIAIGIVVGVLDANAGANTFLIALTIALLVILVMSYVYNPNGVYGRVTEGRTGRSVQLYRVSDAFADAVRRMYAEGDAQAEVGQLPPTPQTPAGATAAT